jgi:thiamine pyrophosphate-dependent acetolactate synthase large subunit-like protein
MSVTFCGGLGTMGFGLPAAMGAKLADPKADVACVTGEGSIQMMLQLLFYLYFFRHQEITYRIWVVLLHHYIHAYKIKYALNRNVTK